MKKRTLALAMAVCLCVASIFSLDLCVLAQESEPVVGTEEDIDYSYFTPLNSLYGHAVIPRGVYLISGDSAISKISSFVIAR